jgi:hypothetical protein
VSTELFQGVVEALGLSMIIGPGVVRRALVDAGSDPKTATVKDYREALGRMETRLASYMTPHDVAARMAKIRALLAAPGR